MIGLSLSPGGLLFPYHVGVLASLEHHGILNEHTPIAGSSAGAIAVCSYAAQVKPLHALEATIRMSKACEEMGGVRGNLLPLLQQELNTLLPNHVADTFKERPGLTGFAYYQVFPQPSSVLATTFETKDEVMDAVCNSSTFPFFTSNWPCRISTTTTSSSDNNGPNKKRRLAMDGFFTEPRNRFGCPTLPEELVDRTICISTFPKDAIGLTACSIRDCIAPDPSTNDLGQLINLATQSTSPQNYHKLYDNGWADTERWIQQYYNDNDEDNDD